MDLHLVCFVLLVFHVVDLCRGQCSLKELDITKFKNFHSLSESADGKPVKLKGVIDNWPCKDWTNNDMLKALGEIKVWPRDMHQASLRAPRTRQTTVSRFVAEPKSSLGIHESFFNPLTRAMNGTYNVSKVLKPLVYQHPGIGIGALGSGIGWYQDDAAFSAQILGSTKWHILPKDAKPGRDDKTCGSDVKVPKTAQTCTLQKGEVILIPKQTFRSWCSVGDDVSLHFGFRGPGDTQLPLWVKKGMTAVTENDPDALTKAWESRPTTATDSDKSVFLSRNTNHAMQCGHTPILTKLEKLGADFDEEDQSGSSHLHSAAQSGQLNSIKFAIKKGADMKQKRIKDGYTAMHAAAQQGMTEVLEFFGKQGKKVWSIKDSQGMAPLHLASMIGHTAAISSLVKSKVDIEDKNSNGYRPLHVASSQNLAGVVMHLLDLKAKINGGDKQGLPPLHHAAISNSQDMAQLLLERSAKLEVQAGDGRRAVHFAAFQGHIEMLQLLHSKGAELMHKDNRGYTPEGLATSKGHTALIDYIRQSEDGKKASPESAIRAAVLKGDVKMLQKTLKGHQEYLTQADDGSGVTLAMKAILSGHLPVLQYLVGRGADVNAKTSWGGGTVHLAAKEGHTKIIEFLEQSDADVNQVDINATTPLILAAQGGHSKIVSTLISLGANVNAKDNNKMSPLCVAVEMKKPKVVEELLKVGADANVINKDGIGMIQVATGMNNPKIVNALLDHGVDVNVFDESQYTPALVASTAGHIPMLKLLIERRADLEYLSEKDELNVLHCAVQGGHVKVVKYLLQEVKLKKDEKMQEMIEAKGGDFQVELEKALSISGDPDTDDAIREAMQDPELRKKFVDYTKEMDKMNPEEKEYLKQMYAAEREKAEAQYAFEEAEEKRRKNKPVVEL